VWLVDHRIVMRELFLAATKSKERLDMPAKPPDPNLLRYRDVSISAAAVSHQRPTPILAGFPMAAVIREISGS